MQRIIKLGFKYVGHWFKDQETIRFEIINASNKKNALYAFIVNQEVKYIGKTTQSLNKRLRGYINPAPSQRTNCRNKKAILSVLEQNERVEIWEYPDPDDSTLSGFHLNIPAALEDDIINQLDPDWNITKQSTIKKNSTEKPNQDHYHQIKTDDFLKFCSEFHCYELTTHARKVKFRVTCRNSRLIITPRSSNIEGIVTKKTIEDVISEFNISRSFITTNYKDITRHSTYILTLLRLYLEDHKLG